MAKKVKQQAGYIRRRDNGRYEVIVNLGARDLDPLTGKATGKRRRKSYSFGTEEDAQRKLREVNDLLDKRTWVDPSEITLIACVEEWFAVAKVEMRDGTVERYQSIIDGRLKESSLARMPLQKVRPTDLEKYYASLESFAASTIGLDHAILHSALSKAVRDELISRNPAAVKLRRRRRDKRSKSQEAQRHAWTREEAAKFLAVAKTAGTQPAAFYATALDSGMRKSELGGLRWANVDLEKGEIHVREQIVKRKDETGVPVFGPTKTGEERTIAIAPETVALLRDHRRAQAELRMKNGTTYANHGLVFAKEWADRRRRADQLGTPLQLNNIGSREFERLTAEAKVRRIKFHGLRHTCATLLLEARVPVHVVSKRLGHAKVEMTMEIYAHVLPHMQQEAAATLGKLLHG